MRKLIQENFGDWLREKASLGDFSYWGDKDLHVFNSKIPYVGFNYVYNLNEESETIQTSLTKAIDTFKAQKVPCILVHQAPASPFIKTFANRMGLMPGARMTGLAYELSTLKESDLILSNPALEIIPVRDDKTLENWCHVQSEAYGVNHNDSLRLFRPLIQTKDSPFHLFLAILNNRPVGCSMLLLGKNNTAGNYWGGVIPEHRGRGINSDMARVRMKFAKELGYKALVVQCLETSLRLYKRLNFKSYCESQFYKFFP